MDERILRGEMDTPPVLMVVRKDERRNVSFLLSSTFTDTEVERNFLLADVVPYLQEFARKLNLEFRLAEMRWGIRAEASSSHQTSEICMSELQRCLHESQGYSYVFLGCQKYGFRPFPSKMPQAIFESLRSQMSVEDAVLMDTCFQLDTNVHVPPAGVHKDDNLNEWLHGAPEARPGPIYVLKSSKHIKDEGTDWWPAFEKMQVAFRAAVRVVSPDWEKVLRDPSSQAYLKKFFISVTEEEFSRGLLWLEDEKQKHQTLAFRRDIADLLQYTAAREAGKFVDMQNGVVDEDAQAMLEQQLSMVPPHVQQIHYPPLPWMACGIDPDRPEHQEYLRTFLDDFARQMVSSLQAAAQKLSVLPDAVVDEVRQHLHFAIVRAEKFTSTSSTAKVEGAARDYLQRSVSARDEDAGSHTALVIYGRSGAGKTFLLSKVMSDHLSSRAAGQVTVIRFLGTTPLSSNVHALLTSVCEQLRRAYGQSEPVPSDFKELKAYFHTAITSWPTADRTLTLFIDSVDQLDDSNAGRRLDWLPVTGLSLHLRLVVSTLPDYPKEFQCLSLLRAKLQHAASQHSRMVEVETISEPEAVLEHLLRLLGRTLTEAQRSHVLEAFAKRTDADAAGTPLWLTIVAQAVAPWPSFGGIRFPIKPAVRELIVDLFERLEMSHGRALVRAAFAYITLAKHGVSETELNHLLSLEDAVLADVYEWWVPPVRVIPPLLPTRLLTDLAPYLTRRGDGSGVELVTWYHRQFWEAAHACLFEQPPDGDAIKQQRHLELADYFSGVWASADKPYSEALSKCVHLERFFQ